MVLLLLTWCLLLLPLWESVIVLCFVVRYFMSLLVHLDGEEKLVALHSSPSWCLVIVVWLLFTMQRACLLFVVVIFPDHTHYFWLIVAIENANNFSEIVVPIFFKKKQQQILIGVLLQTTIVRTIVRAKENLKLRHGGPSYSQKVSEPAKGYIFWDKIILVVCIGHHKPVCLLKLAQWYRLAIFGSIRWSSLGGM